MGNVIHRGKGSFTHVENTVFFDRELSLKAKGVSVNIIFTIFANVFSPIAPTRMRRIRQRGCAAFGA